MQIHCRVPAGTFQGVIAQIGRTARRAVARVHAALAGIPLAIKDLFCTEGVRTTAACRILAPFIPIWSKEWIIPFMLAGLVFPNVRRFLMVRQYEGELNRVVASADEEIARIDSHYLTDGEPVYSASPEAPAAAARAAQAPKTMTGNS